MGKLTKILKLSGLTILGAFVSLTNATPQNEEVLVPTVNPETGQIELRRCPTFPLCDHTIVSPEMIEEDEEQTEQDNNS